ncbi:unnamed protein product [Paramecium primaurelia]|uniref:Uncharacterized protein n=1 Tax=Paramecium primaurelia TaxID=5886 RepID=A0A8S1MLG3_PARPR|nr:unnamed protein product [Paramecium primaurelia]
MNIAERLQREAEKKRIQQEEQMKGGNKAIKEKYEAEYQENKNKLSQEIKQDIKLISQQYPSFQKFALYKIYKQFDFNREIANEFISIQIQNQNQQDNDEDDWIEITSKRKTLIYKMSKSNENNQTPKRSQSVTNKREQENSQQRQSRYNENNQKNQRRNASGDRKREISPRKFNYQNRKYEIFDNDRNNKKQDGRRNQQVNNKSNTIQQNIYQPKYIYVPKYEDDECPYVPKSIISQTQTQIVNHQQNKMNGNNDKIETSNQQSNINQSQQERVQQKLQNNQEILIQQKIKLDQMKQQQEQIRQDQIKQEQIRQDQIRQEQLKQEQLRQEQLKQDQIKQEKLRQEQIQLEQLRQEQQIKQEQLRLQQIKLDQQQQQQQQFLNKPLQFNYQNQSLQQDLSKSQTINQNITSSMFAPQFQIAPQGFIQQNQEHQDMQNQPSVYDMLMSYINYE